MDTMKAQGGIQMLLNAEQDAQQIIASARNVKMARLRQAHDEAEREVTNYRTQLEADYQKQISEVLFPNMKHFFICVLCLNFVCHCNS
nr:V-type proton ATPase subunit G-like [Ipomoea batatas]